MNYKVIPMTEQDKPSKPFWDMDNDEINALAQKAVDDAKERMHKNGVAYVEVIDGKRYHRHPDGSLTPIVREEE